MSSTRDVWIIGTHCTAFGKHADLDFKALARMAYLGVLEDAGLPDGNAIDNAWFGNCGMGSFGQRNIRGQVCFTPLVREGLFPERVPMINVEGGCATASIALHGAWKDIRSGESQLSLALGVEKTFDPLDRRRSIEIFEGGIDQLDPQEWHEYFIAAGKRAGVAFEPHKGGGTLLMDTYAMQAAYHMKRFGTTQRQIAAAASKSHAMGAMNPLAQYRFEASIEQILEDRVVSYPLTRAMCAPIGDGAAAALVCSQGFLETLPPAVRSRAVKIRASVLTGGKYRDPDEPGLSRVAAVRAYEAAALRPEDVHVAEVHDATSFGEIYQAEMLGFCKEGEGGSFVESGATALRGERPINMSGGLVSKGHPVGATGLSMIYELCLQLRDEAGDRQVVGARCGLAENGGGVIGFDEAVCSIFILEGAIDRARSVGLRESR